MKKIMILCTACMLLGCGNNHAASQQSEGDVSRLEERLNKLESDALAASLESDSHDAAYLRPTDPGYALIDSDFGRLAFSIENVESYANGSKIVLQIGNPTMATYSGMKAKVEWGRADKDGSPSDDHKRFMNFAPVDPLPAGSWHNYSLTLADVPPNELGWVRISNFNNGNVSMRRATPL